MKYNKYLLFIVLLLVVFAIAWFLKPYVLIYFKQLNINADFTITWQILNVSMMLVYCILFSILGYKLALKKHKNPIFWSIICGITGVWGWIYLYFSRT